MKKIKPILLAVLILGAMAPFAASTLRADNTLPPAKFYRGTPGKQSTVNNGPTRPGVSGYNNSTPAGGRVRSRRVVRRPVVRQRVVIRRLRARIHLLRQRLRALRAHR